MLNILPYNICTAFLFLVLCRCVGTTICSYTEPTPSLLWICFVRVSLSGGTSNKSSTKYNNTLIHWLSKVCENNWQNICNFEAPPFHYNPNRNLILHVSVIQYIINQQPQFLSPHNAKLLENLNVSNYHRARHVSIKPLKWSRLCCIHQSLFMDNGQMYLPQESLTFVNHYQLIVTKMERL